MTAFETLQTFNLLNGSDAYLYLENMSFDELHIGASGQTDVDCISAVASVKKLYIRWSDIRDISALEGREDIVYLNMESCDISDLSPLFAMPNLKTVEMSAGEQERMEKLISEYGEPGFEIIYL